MSIPRILTIAGTDPSGGAGAQADIKSITATGGFAYSVVTAIVAQNTQGVRSIFSPPPSVIRDQLEALNDDVVIDAVKIGMLGNTGYIQIVDEWLDGHKPPIVVVDPVMVATSGDRLLDTEAEDALKNMLHHATVVTPNIPELEILAQLAPGTIQNHSDAIAAAQKLARDINATVLVKGGHLTERIVTNALVDAEGVIAEAHTERVDTDATHGTGCSLSSALATRLAAEGNAARALEWVTDWLHEAISYGEKLQVGTGHGPVDHSHKLRRMEASIPAQPWLPAPTPLATPESARATDVAQTRIFRQNGKPTEWDVRTPRIAPAGPWTTLLWNATQDVVEDTWELPFIQQLAAGTLPYWQFTAYQRQDALYLDTYARALAHLAARATEPADVAAWAQSSAECVIVEQELHRNWLTKHSDAIPESSYAMSPVTTGYTDHLLARTSSDPYVVGVAAVLPCFWIYAHIGELLAEANTPTHPYHEWLSMYSDQGFIDATAHRIRLMEEALAGATPEERAAALQAYSVAARWECEFFDQARRMR